jgi:hypothetical protein
MSGRGSLLQNSRLTIVPRRLASRTMPLSIELWASEELVDGIELRWDPIEALLAGQENRYPILDSVSPYGELHLAGPAIRQLASECRSLASQTSGSVRAALNAIGTLCEQGDKSGAAELRFEGD